MSTAKRSFMVAGTTTLCVDIATKVIAVAMLSGRAVEVGPLALRLVRNEGVAFGLGDSAPPMLLVVIVATVTAVVAAAVWKGSLPANAATGLVVGGASANLVDRALGGSVVDMFDLGWWPAFNVADVGIVCGVVLLLVQSLGDELGGESARQGGVGEGVG